jgi:hypothetical protein
VPGRNAGHILTYTAMFALRSVAFVLLRRAFKRRWGVDFRLGSVGSLEAVAK